MNPAEALGSDKPEKSDSPKRGLDHAAGQQWIAASDRLPVESGHYIVAWRTATPEPLVSSAYYSGPFKLFGTQHEWQVTHWMPLPAAPIQPTSEEQP